MKFRSTYHDFEIYSGQTVKWLRIDSEIAYQKNLENQKQLLADLGWLDTHFDYTFNSLGFRCTEFAEGSKNIITLGCSVTMGIGMPQSMSWPQLIAAELKLHCYNLGLGGHNNDTAFRLAHYYIPKLKPKIVILLSPEQSRFEIWDKTGYRTLGPWLDQDKTYRRWIENDLNSELNREKNCIAIKQIAESNGSKFLVMNSSDIERVDLARDLMHPGCLSNKLTANRLLELL